MSKQQFKIILKSILQFVKINLKSLTKSTNPPPDLPYSETIQRLKIKGLNDPLRELNNDLMRNQDLILIKKILKEDMVSRNKIKNPIRNYFNLTS